MYSGFCETSCQRNSDASLPRAGDGALPQTAAGELLRSQLIDSRRMVAAGTRTISLLFMAFVTKSIAVYSDACSQS
jgi:hypothetical protein